ncbi:hypothetical protein P3X46_034588, partial [Hevea brasiliensis]
MLCSDDPDVRLKALHKPDKACMQGVYQLQRPEEALKGISSFYDLTEGKSIRQRILFTTSDETKECLRLVTHPKFNCPTKTAAFSMSKDSERKFSVARAFSKILGFEDCYLEKALKLESGFDLKGSYGVPAHTDSGFFVLLIESGTISIDDLTSHGKWVKAKIPPNAMLILNSTKFLSQKFIG